MIKLLMLDVDGVLNDHDYTDAVGSGTIHRDKMEILNQVLRMTGARVVLTSAWRYFVHRGEMTFTGLDWLLRSHGLLCGRLVGITRPDKIIRPPRVERGGLPVVRPDERGEQITAFLEEYCSRHLLPAYYCAVDDLDPGIAAAGHALVRTDSKVGLTAAVGSELVNVLGPEGLPCPRSSRFPRLTS